MLIVKPGSVSSGLVFGGALRHADRAFGVIGRNDARTVDRIGVEIRAADVPARSGKSYSAVQRDRAIPARLIDAVGVVFGARRKVELRAGIIRRVLPREVVRTEDSRRSSADSASPAAEAAARPFPAGGGGGASVGGGVAATYRTTTKRRSGTHCTYAPMPSEITRTGTSTTP